MLILIDVIFLFNWNFLDPLQMKTKYLPTYVSLYNMAFVFVVFQERFAPVYLPRFIHLEKGEGGGGGEEGDSAPG